MKGVSSAVIGVSFGEGAAGAAARSSAGEGKPSFWIRETVRELLVANHMPEEWENVWADFDAESVARMFADAGVQKVCYVAKDAYGFCYYPTKYGMTHPHLRRDEVGEFTAALKKRGIRCIPYVYPGLDRIHHTAHPEWRFTDKKAPVTEKYATMCFNSPYSEEVIFPMMRELVSNYDIDGLFLDIVVHPYLIWNCTCSFCRDKYAREVGGEMPKDGSDPRAFAYRKWLNRCMEEFFERCYRELAKVKKDAVIEYNLAWSFAYPVTPPTYVPFVTLDTPTPDVGLYSWNFSQEARYLSTLPDTVWSCMNTRMGSWGDFSLREPEALMEECAILLAGGGKTYLADLPYPTGKFEPAVYEVFGAVNHRTKDLEPYLKGCRPVSDVAVLHSADTVWSKAPMSPFSEWRGGTAYYPVCGAHKALVEGHVQFGILNSRVFLDTICGYGALVLADQRVLDGGEAETVRRFVSAGGALVATYETGLRDSENQALHDFSLADVFGVRYRETVDSSCCYLRGTPELREFGIPAMDIQVNGPWCRVEPTTARPLLELVAPYRGMKSGTPPPDPSPDGPGVTVNRYGTGIAVYIATDLFGAYFRADTPVLRKLALWALSLAHPQEKRRIMVENTPVTVEMFYAVRGNERFVHLINYCGDKRDTGTPQVQDFPAVHGIRVKVRTEGNPREVSLVPDGKRIDGIQAGGWLVFEAQPLRIHDVYRIVL
jgi:hypothetical protein